MCSLAKSINIKEIAVDANPISLGGDCVSFLVSYLPHLALLNNMHITDQVRKAAMAWRRNKEISNAAFMDLTSDVCLNVRREEVISNARTNWELLRSQTKCLSAKAASRSVPSMSSKYLKPDSDFVLTSLSKAHRNVPPRTRSKSICRVPVLPDKKLGIMRSASQDTENSQNTSSSGTSANEFFRLPPILVPIINKMEQKNSSRREGGIKVSNSVSSVGPNVDSSISSLLSYSENSTSESSSSESNSEDEPNIQVGIPEVVQTTSVENRWVCKTVFIP